jgi:hypothetical protein
MVFCKLSKKLKTRLESAENLIEDSATLTNDVINTHVNSGLEAIEKHKTTISSRIQAKIEEKKQYIKKNIIDPHQERRKKNAATMLYVDISLSVVVCIFLYKLYPFLKRLMNTTNYTQEQLDNATKLPEDAYSKEDLRKVEEFRKSFVDWLEYYKTEDAFSETNVGTPEIRRGNDLREPFKFMIQYVIPYVIVAYIVWFIVKYIKYVIAAIWGFFVTVYQFVTKKITCKLGEKWYIRMATGWSSCHPQFGEYVDRWKNQYIVRPLATERINYLRAVQTARTSYNTKFGNRSPFTLSMDWSWGWFNMFLDWLYNLKRIYFDLPLLELYLQLIKFHPTYVVKPYEISPKNRGDAYPSKTKRGKICKCPPRKTVHKKLSEYISKVPNRAKNVKSKIVKGAKAANAHIDNINEKTNATIDIISEVAKSTNIPNPLGDCNTYDKVYTKRKMVAQGVWTTLMILTTCLVVYSLIYNKNILGSVYKFTNNYNYKIGVSSTTRYMLLSYFAIFFSLGYYSFLE